MKAPTKRGPKWKAIPSTRLTNDLRVQNIWYITPDQLDAMTERMARAIYTNGRRYEPSPRTWTTTWEVVREAYRRDARAALRSIGLSSPTSAAGKGEKL